MLNKVNLVCLLWRKEEYSMFLNRTIEDPCKSQMFKTMIDSKLLLDKEKCIFPKVTD